MASEFSASEWTKINDLFDGSAADYGLPVKSNKSVVIGTFNIRKLGKVSNRTSQSWAFLKKSIQNFDLLAIQEVMDDLSGIEYLQSELGKDWHIVVSDVTGVAPGERGNAERLAFL